MWQEVFPECRTRHNNGQSRLLPSDRTVRLWYSSLTSLNPTGSAVNFKGLFNIVWKFVKRPSGTFDTVHCVHYSYYQTQSHTNAHNKNYKLYISFKNFYRFQHLALGSLKYKAAQTPTQQSWQYSAMN